MSGHVAYAASNEFRTPYVFRLTDYAACSAKFNYLSGIPNGMAAITFLSSETYEFAEN